jgi:hypothetical protein
MNRILILIFAMVTSAILNAQQDAVNRCPYKGHQVPEYRVNKLADDFTITTTDGITRNLYSTLDSGKTVFIDLFYTTCSWCQYYSPIIEEIYQNTGAGEGDIEFWGISNNLYDPDPVIDQYRLNYNITNPCAGPDGGGTTAHTIVISGQNFQGWPTYCVVCPDRTLFFDPCYPPTVTGFDPYFAQCASSIGINDRDQNVERSAIVSVYPNPANNEINLGISIKEAGNVTVEIYNLLGTAVFSSSFEVSQGLQSLAIPVDRLPKGTYFIRLMKNGLFIDIKRASISR